MGRFFQRRRPDPERPGPGQESVWDYPRPPRVEPVDSRLRVEFEGETIAETTRGVRVIETASPPAYYFPPDDVRLDLLEPTRSRTMCEWKGAAGYLTIRAGDRVARDAAWRYTNPTPGFEKIAGYIAFNASRVDAAYVGDERVTPQAGEFYGGWITANLVGPFKGEPGTEGW